MASTSTDRGHEPRTRRSPSGEDGSAVIEFALVAVLALAVVAAVVQVALILYERNVLLSALTEGARVSAGYEGTPAAGIDEARTLLAQELGPLRADVHAELSATDEGPVVVLHATGYYNSVLGFPTQHFNMTARMHNERQLIQDEP